MNDRILSKEEIYLRLIEEEYKNNFSRLSVSKEQLGISIDEFKENLEYKVKNDCIRRK